MISGAEKYLDKDPIADLDFINERISDRLKELSSEISSSLEKFGYIKDYEAETEFRKIILEFRELSYHYIEEGSFEDVVEICRKCLESIGISGADAVSAITPDGAIAIAEAINWAAKRILLDFYELKPVAVVAAWKTGAHFGIGEDSAYYIGSPTIGSASFHDPNDEIGFLVVNCMGEVIPKWEHRWSGILRQHDAFDILESLSGDGSLVAQYADLTTPEEVRKARDKYMARRYHNTSKVIRGILGEENRESEAGDVDS